MTRHFLKVTDLSPEEIRRVLDRARELKCEPIGRAFAGRTVALIFHKPSTRTRVSFSVGVHQQGGMPLYLGQGETQLGTSESIEDTARVLSRYVDAVVIRTFAQADVEAFAEAAIVPVINGLTDERHPCQALTDIFTFEESFPASRGRTITYLGDGNNVAASLAAAAALTGIHLNLALPEGYDLPATMMEELRGLSQAYGTKLEVFRDPVAAVKDSSALYTDVWISMGQAETAEKVRALEPFRVDEELLASSAPDAVVMHCLPAHRGSEITDAVLDGSNSVVFDQAENRLHVQKALLEFLLAEEGK